MGIIVVAGQEAASNTDILQGTRLQTAPEDGIVTFEIQAADNVAANRYVASIQLPSGETPLNDVQVPSGTVAGLAGVLDSRENLTFSSPIMKGGHVVFSCALTGATEMTWRVTYSPIG